MFARLVTSIIAGSVALAFAMPASAAADEAAAKAFGKTNDCFKCHAPDKAKKGPSYKDISAKAKSKHADDPAGYLYSQVTKAREVKLEDGTKEDHKVLEAKDAKEIKNMIQWILSL